MNKDYYYKTMKEIEEEIEKEEYVKREMQKLRDFADTKTRKDRLPKPECDWLCYFTVILVGIAVAIIIFEAIF